MKLCTNIDQRVESKTLFHNRRVLGFCAEVLCRSLNIVQQTIKPFFVEFLELVKRSTLSNSKINCSNCMNQDQTTWLIVLWSSLAYTDHVVEVSISFETLSCIWICHCVIFTYIVRRNRLWKFAVYSRTLKWWAIFKTGSDFSGNKFVLIFGTTVTHYHD